MPSIYLLEKRFPEFVLEPGVLGLWAGGVPNRLTALYTEAARVLCSLCLCPFERKMANSRVRKNEATKLLMLGDSQVGKTSIMLKFCDDIDNILDVKSTVGEYFVVKVHDLWLKSHIQSGDQFEIRQAVIGGRGCHFFSLPWR